MRNRTTFWLTFTDDEAPADKRFLGVAIFDLDGTTGKKSVGEIVRHASELGINPGGTVKIQEVEGISDRHKNKLILDDELLIRLGSSGRKNRH